MEIITYLIPFVTVIVLLSFFRKETAWWEYLLVIIPSLLLALAVEALMKYDNVVDTEYLGYYVTKIRYEEPWNEYIHKTCTDTRVVGHTKNGSSIRLVGKGKIQNKGKINAPARIPSRSERKGHIPELCK